MLEEAKPVDDNAEETVSTVLEADAPAVKPPKAEKAVKTANAFDKVYSKDQLIAGSRARYGVRPSVMAGAISLSGKEVLTEEEAREAIENYRKKPADTRAR